ncbi:hypothetical protein ACIQUM_27200 [Amycolatopsis azurea]|uniref:hypothetical protein n=1 Tax=Amycolatopsis azurea TaxID=36819 RepID=UPI0038034F5F
MTDHLGQKQIAAMFVLMVLAREVSNPEFDELVHFRLEKKEREELDRLGLITCGRSEVLRGRPYVHELTEQGWAWCEEELSVEEAPTPRKSLISALYVLLNGLGRHLRRENLRLIDVFMPKVELTAEEIESRIRIGYRKLARTPRDWVALAELRPMLGEASAVDVDAVLKELSRSGQAHLVPESNRKALTDADHAAAIRIGGEDNHLISIEAP